MSQRPEQFSLRREHARLFGLERGFEQGRNWGGFKHVQVKYAQDFVQGMSQMQSFFDDRDQHVGGNGDPDLCFDRILAGTEERFDSQVLLDSFEEQLDLPTLLGSD